MIKLTYPEENYRYRLTCLCDGYVYPNADPDDVIIAIDKCRAREGDAVASDLRNLCRDKWRRLGL